MFANDCIAAHSSSATTNRGPILVLYFLPLAFPLPALIFLTEDLSRSGVIPRVSSKSIASFVLDIASIFDSIING